MSEYESLREDIAAALAAINDYAAANQRHAEAVTAEVSAIWDSTAELRDELHALANRVETLTRARLTEPAETAERIAARVTARETAAEQHRRWHERFAR